MDYSIQNLKDDLQGILHSTSLDKVRNQLELINRAGRTLIAKIDPDGTKRIAQITNAVHNSIFDYTAPADLKGNKIIDIRPQINRTTKDQYSQRYSQRFDVFRKLGTFQVRHNVGTKSLRLSASIGVAATVLHNMNSLTSNGTWTVGGAATNLRLDTLNKFSGSASLKFDTDGSGTAAFIQVSDMKAVDLEDLENIAQLFDQIFIPDIDNVASWELRWGSSTSDYWIRTVTQPHDQDTFKNGWQTLANDWNEVTEVGSPDSSAVNFLRVTVNLSSAVVETDFRVDKISASSGEIFEIEYYSENLFRNSSGTFQARATDNSDLINLDEDSYNILLNEVAYLMAQTQQGADAGFDANFFREELYGNPAIGKIGLYKQYQFDHASEAIRPRATYWRYEAFRG